MKKSNLLAFVSIAFWFWHCSVSKEAYNMPLDLSNEDKREFVAKFNHGIKLYKINCQKCHEGINKNPDQGPSFTLEQINSYEAFLRLRSETHAFTQKMNSDDIDDIIIYLKYKKIK